MPTKRKIILNTNSVFNTLSIILPKNIENSKVTTKVNPICVTNDIFFIISYLLFKKSLSLFILLYTIYFDIFRHILLYNIWINLTTLLYDKLTFLIN